MSIVELQAGDGAARPGSAVEAGPVPPARTRPNVSGDLPSLFRAAPMFRRALAGYDRFQVDTYVEWAEDELATADREREHLVTRQLSTQAALDEARGLLAHSASGGEFLQLSRRIGSVLATAADEAESMRLDAEADRLAAAAEATAIVADATGVLADAEARAQRVLLETTAEVDAMTARAAELVENAERTRSESHAEAAARLEDVRRQEQLALEQATRIRRQAVEDASVATLRARDEVVRMLDTARAERRRADAEAAALRELMDQDAVTRCASLRAEIEALEQRRSALLRLEAMTGPVARPTGRALETSLRELVDRLRWRSGSLRVR